MRRVDISNKAHEYLGTPFSHLGRLKGIALDCLGLLLCVAEDLGALDVHGVPILRGDGGNYSPQPIDGKVHAECSRRLVHKSLDTMQEGDIITIRMPSIACHVAIVTERLGELYMIHAYQGFATREYPEGRCTKHILSDTWRERIEGVFELPGVNLG